MGEQTGVHVSEVDYIIEGDNQPAAELPNPPPTDVDRAVGRLITAEIDPAKARADVERMCEALHANTVIESYRVEIA